MLQSGTACFHSAAWKWSKFVMAPHVCHIGTPLLLRLSFLSQNFMIPKSLTLQSLCLGGSKDMVFNQAFFYWWNNLWVLCLGGESILCLSWEAGACPSYHRGRGGVHLNSKDFQTLCWKSLQTNMTSRTLTTSMTMAQQTTSHKTTTCGQHSCRQERLVENRNLKTGCFSCDLRGLIKWKKWTF